MIPTHTVSVIRLYLFRFRIIFPYLLSGKIQTICVKNVQFLFAVLYQSTDKKTSTVNTAVMDIVGCDRPNQELTIEFDRKQCIWKFQKAETELWKQPPNPLLGAINEFLTEEMQEWEGTATELTETNHLLKEQTKTLTEDKEKLLFKNEKLEKQQKKLQQELNKMVQSKEVMERNIHAYDEDVK